ncbi:uncharacterized protein LOC141714799 [Apium graveolens]|uniref:uncharacterized protein LOC141714799 n=1 Tax=Apium graveolens TaxID=4045 RepID=UPI003D7ACCA8
MLMWTPQMDEFFLQAMLTQQYHGNRIDGTFTSTAYTNMVNELHEKLNMNFSKSHLKNRLKTLKDHFAQYYDLFRGVGLSGFAWNSETKLFEADNEVWDSLIEVSKPDAIKWKTKKIHNYNELAELFAKDRAIGAAAGTAKEKKKQWSKTTSDQTETLEDVDRLLSTNKVTLENLIVDDDVFISSMPSLEEVQMNLNSSKNKKRKYEEDESMTLKIMSSLEAVGDAIKEGNAILKDSNIIMERSRQRVYSGDEIYNELELLNLEPNIISKAYLLLIKDQDSAQALFGCPARI